METQRTKSREEIIKSRNVCREELRKLPYESLSKYAKWLLSPESDDTIIYINDMRAVLK